mgnify:CR=1 FL=1
MSKCLIVGFGNIAKTHIKYLNKNGIAWDWYDPYIVSENTDRILHIDENTFRNNIYDRIFILSNEASHYKNYKQIRDAGYAGWIFVEKPAVLEREHFDIFDDSRVICGLVERFNPAIATLMKHIDLDKVINIDFSRCCVQTESSKVSALQDIGIHDIDLFFYLTKLTHTKLKFYIVKNNSTVLLTIDSDISARFIWSKDTFFKERKIIVRQSDCTYIVDLQDQICVKNHSIRGKIVSESLFVEKSSPIENEHNNLFLEKPQPVDCRPSHEFLLRIN